VTLETADYEQFVRLVTPRLLRYAHSLCGDAHIAQDLVQEALLRIYQHWAEVDPSRNPVAYAHRTVHNLYVNRAVLRSTAETPRDTFLDSDWVTEPGEAVQLRIDVARVLAILPPKERAVLVARYLNDLSVADTATLLGVSEAWVRTTSYRALVRLKAVQNPSTRPIADPASPAAF